MVVLIGLLLISLRDYLAGTYNAMVIDATGSTDGQNVNVLEPAAYTANITATNISCNGACDGNAAVVVTGGTQTLTTVDVQQKYA